ncbi:Ras guanine nucleotide exchange factor E [Trachymyrmex septentrionalis]|uniref:Ras guanine nucleotide exchange factor E n=1 Tax=Trachymyrmex septentrionalis TaxID=34720 RepID=A0A195FBI7_9HYME|nr:Ras guanine nucleotide exchange factor E [Trachymyrmex septentrionalis]
MNALRGTRLFDRSRGRIRKLLLSEYHEFSETILVESSFAETTRNGRGIRQVSLGLTPTRLIVAADILQTNPCFFCPSCIDASIESFELVSVYPLEYVTLSVFRRRRHKTLKARFIDGRVNYYELGGEQRRVSWKIWCEQIRRLLTYKTNGSSLSETTAASSSSSSALYLLSSEIEIRSNRDARCKRSIFRVWSHYGGAGDYIAPTWTEKNLYLGPSYNELMNGNYTPVPVRFAGASLEDLRYELEGRTPRYIACEKSCHSWPCQTKFDGRARFQRADGLCNVLFARSRNYVCHCDYTANCKKRRNMFFEDDFVKHVENKYGKRQQQYQNEPKGTLTKISRFGFGVSEKCNSELILGPYRGDSCYENVVDARKLLENGVTIWEDNCRSLKGQRHPRRYGLSSAAHFFHALGPWSVQPGERESVQTLRSPSAVNIRRQPSDPELRLPVSRRQLTASISCTALTPGGSNIIGAVTRGRVILFWTPEYWYRPQAAVTAYRELRHHLASLQNFRCGKEKQSKGKFFYRRKNRILSQNDNTEVAITGKSSGLLDRVFSINGARKRDGKTNRNVNVDEGTAQLRRLLRMNLRITMWDLDSTTFAVQLTSIDRDLFVRIPTTEIEALIYQRSSRNAPNLGAWIAFSHRIACLTVSEILAIKQLDMRTRIMARFINAADKCLALGNFQSCRSILAGLQAPPIYRLRRSWSYLRIHHASRYAAMERLSKIYKSPQCSKYRKVWTVAKRNPPCMPYVGHFLIKILGLNSLKEIQANFAPKQFFTKKQLTARIHGTSESLSINNNFNDRHSRDDKNLIESKPSLARRILIATLTRMKFTAHQNVTDETKSDVWTCGQRYLARRFFNRWRVFTLEMKVRSQNKSKLKNADLRRRHIIDIATWLTDCQRFALGYNFPLNSFACEYLLKARYREDRENFFISLMLEPPRTT